MNYLWDIIKRYRQKIDKYKKRSATSIEYSKNINSDYIISLKNIKSKIIELGKELGLGGDGISKYGYYSPTEQDGIFQLRISNHNNDNPSLYAKWELNGVPNVRHILVFMGNGDSIETIPRNENHGVIVSRYTHVFPMYYLDYHNNIDLLKKSLIEMFRTGNFIPPKNFDKPLMPKRNNENKQYNTMNKIRLTESQLHRVIKEAVNKVILSEGMLDTVPMAGEMPRGNEQKVQQAISLAQEGLAQLQSLGAVNPQSAPWLQDARRELKNLSFRAKSQGNYNQQSVQMGDYQQ